MTILNESTVTKALYDLIRKNLPGYMIERNEPENTDPNRARQQGTGWIGIYSGNVNGSAYTIGRTPYKKIIQPKIVVQVVSMQSGEDAEDKLEKSIYDILTLVLGNKSISGTVYMINSYTVDEPKRSFDEDFYFYKRTIQFECEVRE